MINIPGGCLREPYARRHRGGCLSRTRPLWRAEALAPAGPSRLTQHETLHHSQMGFALVDTNNSFAVRNLAPEVRLRR